MADAGEIKAKVTIEYDGSGIEKAKEDLASLAEAAGSFGQGGAGETLVSMDEGAQKLATSMGALTPQLESGQKAIWQLVEGGAPGQQMLLGMGTAVEALQGSLGDAVPLLESGGSSMQLLTERADQLATKITPVNESFAQLSDSLASSVPMLPQFAESLQGISETVGGSHFAENLSAFQDAMVNPYPFQMIGQYLNETGQSWGDFTSSIGDSNTQMLHEMAQNADVTHQVLGGMGADAKQAGQMFTESAGGAAAFTDQFNSMGEAVGKANEGINAFGGAGNVLAGPLEELQGYKAIGFGEAFGNAGTGIMGALNNIAMPLMAVQMIAMAVGAVGSAIYNAAAVAEGPAAHGFGTFTGTVDALGQSAARSGQQFSEGFGQGVLPVLNELNYETTQGQQSMGPFGQSLGLATSTLASLWQIGTGTNVTGGFEGLANVGAQIIGVQQPFQGPGPAQQAQVSYQQSVASMPQTVTTLAYQSQTQAAQYLQMASDPQYLAAQDQAMAAQQAYQRAQANYNSRHYISPQQALMNYQADQYDTQQNALYNQQMQGQGLFSGYDFGGYWGGIGSGVSNFFGGMGSGISNWWNGLWKSGDSTGITAGSENMGPQVSEQIGSMQLPHMDLSGISAQMSGQFGGMSIPHIDMSGISASLGGMFSSVQVPSPPDIMGQINSQLGSMFSNAQVPSPPDIMGQVNSQLGGMFSNAQVPSPPDIMGQINSQLGGMFSNAQIPSPPDIMGQINSQLGGMFSGFSLPSLPNIAGMINSAMSGMFSGISIPSVPFFASGIENFGGGLAVVGDAGPELVSLPSGSSVYPMSAGAGVGGGTSPISLGGSGGGSSAPQFFNLHLYVGDSVFSQMGIPLAQNMRLVSGNRSY